MITNMATPGMQNTRTMDAKTTKRGRPRKGQALRVPLTFSVDPATRQKAQELRNAGYALNELVEKVIIGAYRACTINGIYKLELSAWGIESQEVQDIADEPFADTE